MYCTQIAYMTGPAVGGVMYEYVGFQYAVLPSFFIAATLAMIAMTIRVGHFLQSSDDDTDCFLFAKIAMIMRVGSFLRGSDHDTVRLLSAIVATAMRVGFCS